MQLNNPYWASAYLAQAQAFAAVPSLASEPELSHAQVGLTDSLLGDGQNGQTLLGSTVDKKYAVKLYDNRQPEAIHACFNEKRCLQALTHCQSIVQFEIAGRLQDSLYPCIVTRLAGSPAKQLSHKHSAAAKAALTNLHAAGAAHGDVRLPNLLFNSDASCCLADLANCTTNASKEAKDKDMQQLSRI